MRAREAFARAVLASALLLGLLIPSVPAFAQKQGGTLRIYHRDNPPSASPHEEATVSVTQPFMAVFNNLVLFDQTKPLNSLDTIVPDLAASWSWDASKTKLTFKLREGVKWHDGKPFTAKDVQCTWHAVLGATGRRSSIATRARSGTTIWRRSRRRGDHEATFHLRAPQPSFLMLLASGFSPVYPCHVSQRDMRTKPVGHRALQVRRAQPQHRHQARAQSRLLEEGQAVRRCHRHAHHRQPLDAHPGVRVGRVRHDLRPRRHGAADEGRAGQERRRRSASSAPPTSAPTSPSTRPPRPSTTRRSAGPWRWRSTARPSSTSSLRARRRWARPCCRRPEGQWALPPEELAKLPGYGADVAQNQAEAQKIMASLGYGPGKPLKVKVSVQEHLDLPRPRGDPDRPAQEDPHRRRARADRHHGVVRQGAAQGLLGQPQPDGRRRRRSRRQPDRELHLQVRAQLHAVLQSRGRRADLPAVARRSTASKRKQLVWEVERKLALDVVRPIIFHNRAATCWHPHVKGVVLHQNSIYNNWRLEDVWLDK